MKTRPVKTRHLLVTMTNEPFQPARLYYSVPDPARWISLKAPLRAWSFRSTPAGAFVIQCAAAIEAGAALS